MRLAFLIAAVSAAVLGYEIALMRALSVARWHHFAYMVVSVALLGFGASGTLLSLWGRRLLRCFGGSVTCLAVAFAIAIPASFALSQRVPFDVSQLGWDRRQYLCLFEHYLIVFVPFLLGATCIGLAFVREVERVHKLYFWNLLGSGIGACGIVALMFALPPAKLPLAAFAAAGLGAVVYATRRLWQAVAALGSLTAALVAFTLIWPLEIEVSQYKPLRYLLDLPEARVVAESIGPLGVVQVVDSPALHLVAGLSMAYQGEEPRQRALVVDAGSASAINHLTQPDQAKAFDYTTSALAYHLLDRPRTLVVGAGGGSDVLLARHHGCPSITALELNPAVVALMQGSQAEFAQHLYSQPGVELVAAEARGFLARTDQRYDVIQLPLVESFGAAASGVAALSESYLYTIEALDAYLDRLADGGIVSITRWLKTPPSDAIRTFATATEALRRRGIAEVGRHVACIRGWSTATILLRKTPFPDQQVAAVRDFCDARSFDLVWLHGMATHEANQSHEFAQPYYADAARKLLSDERDDFLRTYALDVSPTTDDRPYHALTFRWRALRLLRPTMGQRRVRLVDSGYLVLVATVGQAAAAGLVLIVLLLFFLRREERARGGRLATCVYFACLGMAYMFIEIVMMQKLSLFLASPIYAAAVVLTSFMVFSGLGSLAAGRLLGGERRAATFGIAGIVVVGLATWLGLDELLGRLWSAPGWVRVAVATASAGSLAFFMGMPFPSGLRRVGSRVPALTPWAWGVNGSASVVGAALAMLLAVSFGFRTVLLIAFGLYAAAALVLGGIRQSHAAPS